MAVLLQFFTAEAMAHGSMIMPLSRNSIDASYVLGCPGLGSFCARGVP